MQTRGAQRRHGCHAPFDALQIAAWFFFLPVLVSFYAAITPYVRLDLAIPTSVLYALLLIVIAVTYVIASVTDVADDNVIAKWKREQQQLSGKKSNRVVDSSSMGAGQSSNNEAGDIEERFHCYTCDVDVDKRSKHCRTCNKCIDNFDHHCRWLNTCVGGKTYKVFIGLLVSLFLLLLLHFGMAVAIVVDISVFNVSATNNAYICDSNAWRCTTVCHGSPLLCDDSHDFPVYYIVLLCCTLLLVVPFGGLVAQLLFLHLYLIRKGITTYEYIIAERSRKIEHSRRKVDEEREANRKKASKKAPPEKTADKKEKKGRSPSASTARELQKMRNKSAGIEPEAKSGALRTGRNTGEKDSERHSVKENSEETLERMQTPVQEDGSKHREYHEAGARPTPDETGHDYERESPGDGSTGDFSDAAEEQEREGHSSQVRRFQTQRLENRSDGRDVEEHEDDAIVARHAIPARLRMSNLSDGSRERMETSRDANAPASALADRNGKETEDEREEEDTVLDREWYERSPSPLASYPAPQTPDRGPAGDMLGPARLPKAWPTPESSMGDGDRWMPRRSADDSRGRDNHEGREGERRRRKKVTRRNSERVSRRPSSSPRKAELPPLRPLRS